MARAKSSVSSRTRPKPKRASRAGAKKQSPRHDSAATDFLLGDLFPAKKKVSGEAAAAKLKRYLKQAFDSADVDATIRVRRVGSTGFYGVVVESSVFDQLPYSTRQNLVWRIADRCLSPGEQLLISGISTLGLED